MSFIMHVQPSSCLSNREENEIYSYTQNDLANRMARNAIDSKSALNLNGMQHSYPGARTNFFYDFSATGKADGRERGGEGMRLASLWAVWFLWLLIQLNWFAHPPLPSALFLLDISIYLSD